MAAELQPLEPPITDDTTTSIPTEIATTTATTTLPSLIENVGPHPPPKRQRRPSVRLGEIGDQPATISYDTQLRRPKFQWRFPKDSSNLASKTSKSRPLTNLVRARGDLNGDVDARDFSFGDRKVKVKRSTATRRVRSNWASIVDEGECREDDGEGFTDFDPESNSPLKDQSPINSMENDAFNVWHSHRRAGRARVSQSNDATEMEYRDTKESENGVRSWLIELGLSRYAPMFEIHEVDEGVLPMLTLEDLKDMGINAVGSRRKMYSAIQKLRKALS